MKLSLRSWLLLGSFAALLTFLAILGAPLLKAADGQTALSGQLTEQSLGNLLSAMGIAATKEQSRYDFAFKAVYGEDEWDLTMSSVLSRNGQWLWVMAWLDELPKSAADVPRSSLLRMLADNDAMGTGKFFAFVPGNRRFVLQRVVKNEDMSVATFQEVLKDVGASVVETYPHWNVENWTESSAAPETNHVTPTGSRQTTE